MSSLCTLSSHIPPAVLAQGMDVGMFPSTEPFLAPLQGFHKDTEKPVEETEKPQCHEEMFPMLPVSYWLPSTTQQCQCSILRIRSCRWLQLCGAFHPCRTAPTLRERQATATPGKKELIFSEWHNLANDNCDFCLGCGVKSEGWL